MCCTDLSVVVKRLSSAAALIDSRSNAIAALHAEIDQFVDLYNSVVCYVPRTHPLPRSSAVQPAMIDWSLCTSALLLCCCAALVLCRLICYPVNSYSTTNSYQSGRLKSMQPSQNTPYKSQPLQPLQPLQPNQRKNNTSSPINQPFDTHPYTLFDSIFIICLFVVCCLVFVCSGPLFLVVFTS